MHAVPNDRLQQLSQMLFIAADFCSSFMIFSVSVRTVLCESFLHSLQMLSWHCLSQVAQFEVLKNWEIVPLRVEVDAAAEISGMNCWRRGSSANLKWNEIGILREVLKHKNSPVESIGTDQQQTPIQRWNDRLRDVVDRVDFVVFVLQHL